MASEEERNKKREYAKNRYQNMSEEKKQKSMGNNTEKISLQKKDKKKKEYMKEYIKNQSNNVLEEIEENNE